MSDKKEFICPCCKKPMEYLGNIANTIMLTYPPKWDETYACHKCGIKKTIRRYGDVMQDHSDIKDYKEV